MPLQIINDHKFNSRSYHFLAISPTMPVYNLDTLNCHLCWKKNITDHHNSVCAVHIVIHSVVPGKVGSFYVRKVLPRIKPRQWGLKVNVDKISD